MHLAVSVSSDRFLTTFVAACRMRRVAGYDHVVFFNTLFRKPLTLFGIRFEPLTGVKDWESYNIFVLVSLHAELVRIFGSYTTVTVFQYDGFVANKTRWDPRFHSLDFIGAPFRSKIADPDFIRQDGSAVEVGNGGFSMRSFRLMKEVRSEVLRIGSLPFVSEDGVICRILFSRLTEAGLRFAEVAIAERFSIEDPSDLCRFDESYGFHGKFILKTKYPLTWFLMRIGL